MPSRLSLYTNKLRFPDGFRLYKYVKGGNGNADTLLKLFFLQHAIYLRYTYAAKAMLEQISLNEEYKAPVNFSSKTFIDPSTNVGYANTYFANRLLPVAKTLSAKPKENNYQIGSQALPSSSFVSTLITN